MAHHKHHHRDELEEYLNRRVDIPRLIRKIDITDEDPVSAAAEQPSLFLEVARYRVQLMRNRTQVGLESKKLRAKAKIHAREKKKRHGNAFTEKSIDDHIEMIPEIRKMEREFEKKFRHEEFAKLFLDAYRMREKAVKVIIDARRYEADTYARDEKEKEGERMTRKIAKEVRKKYNQLSSSSSSSSSD